MFRTIISEWEHTKSELSQNVNDKVGASLERELFDEGKNQLERIEGQYLEAEDQKNEIKSLLAELRGIV
ncbi:MAG: hypothetical protein K6D02_02870 [Lachnospiraceae bacterium]|nr:hypothetical protein [Lachnospiraceae bacterium]